MALFNFKLAPLENILPFGEVGNATLNFYALTWGSFWLEIGDYTVYEYTNQARRSFQELKREQYSSYYLIQFIDDFINLFNQISQSLPEKLYDLVSTPELVTRFYKQAEEWLNQNNDEENNFYFDKYNPAIEWIDSRLLDTGYLVGSPKVYFLRCKDDLNIVWQADYKTDSGISYLTSTSGRHVMNYSLFTAEAKSFGERFFTAMEQQIKSASTRAWPDISFDYRETMQELGNKKTAFLAATDTLTSNTKFCRNWQKISRLINEMQADLK